MANLSEDQFAQVRETNTEFSEAMRKLIHEYIKGLGYSLGETTREKKDDLGLIIDLEIDGTSSKGEVYSFWYTFRNLPGRGVEIDLDKCEPDGMSAEHIATFKLADKEGEWKEVS